MYSMVYFEICGKCNAKCKWCPSGRAVLEKKGRGGFIEPAEYARALDYMFEKEFIGSDTLIGLYNYGEPMLHPEIESIIQILNERNLHYAISTNASAPKLFSSSPGLLKNLSVLIFSMPGFSQASYDKMHGFNFERIKENIAKMIENYRANGFSGTGRITYHLYQHNNEELKDAFDFAESLGLGLFPFYARFIGYDLMKDYLTDTMDYGILKEASQELLLFHLNDMPENSKDVNSSCP